MQPRMSDRITSNDGHSPAPRAVGEESAKATSRAAAVFASSAGLDPGAHAYPRPQLRRAEWASLNGIWSFAIDDRASWTAIAEVVWDKAITVPFAPQTPKSGVEEAGLFVACWYKRTFEAPELA